MFLKLTEILENNIKEIVYNLRYYDVLCIKKGSEKTKIFLKNIRQKPIISFYCKENPEDIIKYLNKGYSNNFLKMNTIKKDGKKIKVFLNLQCHVIEKIVGIVSDDERQTEIYAYNHLTESNICDIWSCTDDIQTIIKRIKDV